MRSLATRTSNAVSAFSPFPSWCGCRLIQTVLMLSLNVSEECQSLWNFDMKVSASGINTDGRLQDMVLFPDGRCGYQPLGIQEDFEN